MKTVKTFTKSLEQVIVKMIWTIVQNSIYLGDFRKRCYTVLTGYYFNLMLLTISNYCVEFHKNLCMGNHLFKGSNKNTNSFFSACLNVLCYLQFLKNKKFARIALNRRTSVLLKGLAVMIMCNTVLKFN